MENEYFDLGKLFFTVDIKDIVEDSVSVIIDIEENKNVHITNTFFEKIGNIDSSIVLRELTYKHGDLYTKKNTDKTIKQLKGDGNFFYG